MVRFFKLSNVNIDYGNHSGHHTVSSLDIWNEQIKVINTKIKLCYTFKIEKQIINKNKLEYT